MTPLRDAGPERTAGPGRRTRPAVRAAAALAVAGALALPSAAAKAAPSWTSLLRDPSLLSIDTMHAAGDKSLWAFTEVEGPDNTRVTVARLWNGKRWRTVPLPANGYVVSADSSSPSDVWAFVAPFSDDATSDAAILHWDGRSWKVSYRPKKGETGESLITSLGKGRAVTSLFTGRGTRVLSYSGGKWRGRTADGLALTDLRPLSPRAFWAVGGRIKGDREHVYRYDGTKWRRQSPPKALLKMSEKECLRLWPGLPRSECPTGRLISVVPHTAKNVQAVVRFEHPTPITRLLRWDGSRWSRVGKNWREALTWAEPDGKGGFWGLTSSDGELLRYRAGRLGRVATPKGGSALHAMAVSPSGRFFLCSSEGLVWRLSGVK